MTIRTEIFVFGSNLAGRHGKGAAAFAQKHHGAIYGRGEGLQGNSYAIPTKSEGLVTLPVQQIREAVKRFVQYAVDHQGYEFHLTAIGCGLAGYVPRQIAPMFVDAPDNVILPIEFEDIVAGERVRRDNR